MNKDRNRYYSENDNNSAAEAVEREASMYSEDIKEIFTRMMDDFGDFLKTKKDKLTCVALKYKRQAK